MRHLLLCTFALAALAAGVSGPSRAARLPTTTERAQIIRAVKVYVDTSSCCVIISRLVFRRIRVSTVDRRWAVVWIDGYGANGSAIGPAIASVHRGFLSGRWGVRSFGSDGQSCDAPPKVRRDLGLSC
jgi:hypothetical protein